MTKITSNPFQGLFDSIAPEAPKPTITFSEVIKEIRMLIAWLEKQEQKQSLFIQARGIKLTAKRLTKLLSIITDNDWQEKNTPLSAIDIRRFGTFIQEINHFNESPTISHSRMH